MRLTLLVVLAIAQISTAVADHALMHVGIDDMGAVFTQIPVSCGWSSHYLPPVNFSGAGDHRSNISNTFNRITCKNSQKESLWGLLSW